MLVLSRQRHETIIIGDDIEITVVDVRGEKVRLGISCPTHVSVHRKEVYESIKREEEANRRRYGKLEKGLEDQNPSAGQNNRGYKAKRQYTSEI